MVNDVVELFRAVRPDRPRRIVLTNPLFPGNMPREIGGMHHQQGIQICSNGGFVISGSAGDSGASYFFVTDASLMVRSVVQIDRTLRHAGGFQIIDNVLAVGIEQDRGGGSRVCFYDLVQQLAPRRFQAVIERQPETAGGVGVTRQLDGSYVVAVAGYDAERLDLYRLPNRNAFDSATPLRSFAYSEPQSAARRPGPDMGSDAKWAAYQNINLFTDIVNRLWLVGTHTDRNILHLRDWADLWLLEPNDAGDIALTKFAKMSFSLDGRDATLFDYGAGYSFDEAKQSFGVVACEAHMQPNGTVRCDQWFSQ